MSVRKIRDDLNFSLLHSGGWGSNFMPSPSSPYVVCRYSKTLGPSEACGHVKSSDESSDWVLVGELSQLTYFAEHEGEDKSAGRSVPRLEE